ncbi:MAG: hypothetical protein G01um10148_973 [Parcubacteria group bacterium Gr01-1014_8]|nr:MAG: hypothetical protein G01um10148_973 [Parcubacteria group bacterium Gr01-1014_8]
MATMTKILIAGVVVVLVAIAGLFLWQTYLKKPEAAPVTLPEEVKPVQTTDTYASSTLGISITYPKGYTVNEAYAYDQVSPTKLIHGVKFVVPETAFAGTNLSVSDTGVSIEWLPRAKKCTGDIYLPGNVVALSFADGGTAYSVATSSGAAAGNFYEEKVYAIASSSPCTAVRYFLHSSNIGNYATGTAHEFDRAALLSDFDKIRQSLKISR